MQPRSLLILLLLPCCAVAQEDAGYLPPVSNVQEQRVDERWNGSFGFGGGSMNFHQDGNVGVDCNWGYNLIQGKRSSLSLGQGLILGTSDQYGISFPPFLAVTFALAFVGHAGSSRRVSRDKVGCYIGGGFTHTFMPYTNSLEKAVQTDYWAWIADGGIRLRKDDGGAFCIGLGVGEPLRTPIGPIHDPVFFQRNLTWMPKP